MSDSGNFELGKVELVKLAEDIFVFRASEYAILLLAIFELEIAVFDIFRLGIVVYGVVELRASGRFECST